MLTTPRQLPTSPQAILLLPFPFTDGANALSRRLVQLRLSPSKAEKSNTSAKGLLGIAKKLMNLLAIPSKHFALVFDFSAI